MNESSFEGVGGLNIFTRSWQPEGKPRGVVVIVHGLNSHSGQYFWAGEQFATHDLAVYALDHRGRGRSDGERFYVEKVEDYVDDVATFVTMAKLENPGLPVFVLGHSAGGVIACVYALDHQKEISGLICESFAYELPVPDLVLSFLKGLSHITPHTQVFKLNNKDFSRDPQVVESMNNDPLIKDESQPTQTAATMVRADERLRKEFPLITLPLLILHGTDDKATKPSGSQHFNEQAGSTDKTLKLYKGHYHDLLNDIDKEVVMADIQQWIDERIPAESSAVSGA
ncbi:alpha/beta hydrolase [Nostoc sp. NMS8]|uniref:alpha/beta hydrolase n=1 Tax=Nostoc sp. NMS8 TaxID=2815392 RepID=UPI0025E6F68B|nr:alpha/beta hydrolase [Nostoc sp. NMS8]MBN3957316.1 lysophospholipase [Nostoc sp. NMS8]